MHMGILYQAGQYRKALSRKNSTICQYYTSIDGSIHIGSIQLIGMATEPFVIIKQYNKLPCGILVDQDLPSLVTLQQDYIPDVLKKYFSCVNKLSVASSLCCIPASQLQKKCVCIPIKHSPVDYIITIPNFIEHH